MELEVEGIGGGLRRIARQRQLMWGEAAATDGTEAKSAPARPMTEARLNQDRNRFICPS